MCHVDWNFYEDPLKKLQLLMTLDCSLTSRHTEFQVHDYESNEKESNPFRISEAAEVPEREEG